MNAAIQDKLYTAVKTSKGVRALEHIATSVLMFRRGELTSPSR